MKKRSAFFITMLLLLISVHICALAEGELTIETKSLKWGNAFSEYSDFIRASGGEEPYTFSSSALPRGLSINSETGEISGIPQVNAQFRNITFRVTDAAGTTVTKRMNMYINPRLIDFRISNYVYTYSKENAPYKATLQCIQPDVEYSVYYDNDPQKTEVYNAAEHPISIFAPSCRVRNVYDENGNAHPLEYYSLYVYRNPESNISIESGRYFYQEGVEHEAAVTVVPADLPYEVTYSKRNNDGTQTEYTSQAPTEIGTYSVYAKTTDGNYIEREATGTMIIEYRRVTFSADIADKYTYNGSPQAPDVTTDSDIPADSWQILYRNVETNEITSTPPTNKGTYEINIDFKDNPYEAEFETARTFTIDPMPVDFNVTSEHTVIQTGHNFNVKAEPIDNTLITDADYSVWVVDLEGHEFNINEPRDRVGEYRSKVKIENPNFILGNANVLELNVSGGCDFEVNPAKTEIVYGESFDITVIAKNNVLHDYTVELTDTKNVSHTLIETAEHIGDHTSHWGNSEPLDVGTYTVKIQHNDSEHHFIGDVTGTIELTVVPLEVNFDITASPIAVVQNTILPSFNVTPSTDLITAEDYTVIIPSNSSETGLSLGDHTADIELNEGVKNFIKGTVTSNTFSAVGGVYNFKITANPEEITYGKKFTLNVDVESLGSAAGDYKITILDKDDNQHELTYNSDTGTYESEVLDAGNYSVKAEKISGDSSTVIGEVDAPSLKVNPLPITFDINGADVEEGNAFEITVTPSSDLVKDSDYRLRLVNKNGGTHSPNYILPRGEYTTRITLNNPNFTYDGSSEKKFSVTKRTIDFQIEANPAEITYGEKFNLTVTPSDITGYTLSLVDEDGGKHSTEDILDVGTYTVLMEYDGDEYIVGDYTEISLTVTPAPVTFTVTSNTEFDYEKGAKRTVQVSNEAGITDYTIQYKLNDIMSDDAEAIGEYEIVVTITNNPNYVAAPITEKLIIRDPTTMNMGNSPAAMILQYGGDNAQQLLEEFKTNYTMNGININGISDTTTYNDVIWNDMENLDTDPSAVFVRKFTQFQDPGLTYTNAEGETVTIYGEIEGSESIDPKARAVYDVKYRYGDIERVRKLVVLGGKTANANGDRNINSIDANVICTLIGTEPKNMAEKILYYRICDLNQDGNVTQEDADAITNRFETPINEYYPWVVE